MADIYAAQLDPTKPEAVATYLSARLGAGVTAQDLRMITSFRFDDPAGEVGCETHIAAVTVPQRGELLVQVPFTYRGAPLEGAPAEALVTRMDHSVLGDRWVYDAAFDPVYATELLLAITDAGGAAEQFAVGSDGSRTQITEGLANVRGTGAPTDPADAAVDDVAATDDALTPAVERTADATVIRLRGASVAVLTVLDADGRSDGAGGRLLATWDGQQTPVELARLAR
jgi:hypothetical protein